MYFVLKILKIFYLHYSTVHVSDTTVSIIRSFSAAHTVSGPVCCLVRCVLQCPPHGTRDCMCSWEAPDDGHSGVWNM